MPGSSENSSFIPKRGAKKNTRTVRNANVYIMSVISYVVFFAALIASAAAYLYSQNVSSQLNEEIATMSKAVGNFKEADLQRVQEFDVRLRQASQRLEHSASVVAILSSVESVLIDTVRLTSLSITRNFDVNFVVKAEAETDTYGSAIFQRSILENFSVVEAVELRDVALQPSAANGEVADAAVTLTALLSIPVGTVPYTVGEDVEVFTSLPEPDQVEESTSDSVEDSTDDDVAVDDGESNEDNQ